MVWSSIPTSKRMSQFLKALFVGGCPMGLLDILKGKLKDAKISAEGVAHQIKSRRQHVRYAIDNAALCILTSNEFGRFKVLDLSFLACFVEPMDENSFPSDHVPKALTLIFMDKQVNLQISQIKKRGSGWVISFEHTDDKSFMELNKILDPLRCGASAIEMVPANLKESLKSKLRKRYLGDGPFDLIVERDSSGNINFAMVTQRRGDIYSSVLWEAGNLVTKKNVDTQGVGARMAQTPIPDMDLVFAAAAACVGVKGQDGIGVALILCKYRSEHIKAS